MRAARAIVACIGVVGSLAVVHNASAEWDTGPLTGVVTAQHYLCGKNDLPEGPIQGHVPKADQQSRRAE